MTISEAVHSACHNACMTTSERSDKSVSENCSDDLIWQIIAVVAIICLTVLLFDFFTRNTKQRKEMCQKVTLLCQNTRKDDYVLAVECPNVEEPGNGEEPELGVQMRNADDRVVDLQHPHTDMDVGEVTQPETQIQNPPQQTSTQQHVLETTNGSPQLQQPSVNNTVHEEMPPNYDSLLNGSNISSPTSLSSSSSSVSTSNDSGVSSGREGRRDHENLTQQSSQTCLMTNHNCGNQQSHGERRADVSFHTNTSAPDGESSIVTSLTVYSRD